MLEPSARARALFALFACGMTLQVACEPAGKAPKAAAAAPTPVPAPPPPPAPPPAVLPPTADDAIDEALTEGFHFEDDALEVACTNSPDAATSCQEQEKLWKKTIAQRRERFIKPLREEAERVASEAKSDVPCVSADPSPNAPCLVHVTLLNPGNGPKLPLRYDFGSDTTRLIYSQDFGTFPDGQLSHKPMTHYDVAATAHKTADVTTTTYRITRAYVHPFDMMAKLMDRAVSGLAGSELSVVTDKRGFTRSVSYTAPSNPPMAAMLRRVVDRLAHLTVPLPEEPVGVGATWRVTSVIGDQRSVMLYRLSSLSAKHFAVLVAGWQRSAPLPKNDPYMSFALELAKKAHRPLPHAVETLVKGSARIKRKLPMRLDKLTATTRGSLEDAPALRLDLTDELVRDVTAYDGPDDALE